MGKSLFALAGAVLIGISCSVSFPVLAQQKTVKACQEEWRANKAANQAKGMTEKVYVVECRAGGAAAQSRAQTTAPSSPPQAATGQKTVKACQEEWRADKAANQAKGITEKAYVAECRAGGVAAQSGAQTTAPSSPPQSQKTVKVCTQEWRANKASNQAKGITEKSYVEQCRAVATAATPTATTPPTSGSTSAAGTPSPVTPSNSAPGRPSSAPTASATPTGANQFMTETEAKGHCPADTVVWVNLHSKIYHFAGHKAYGHTKAGAYMCEKDTAARGMRASKDEKRPG